MPFDFFLSLAFSVGVVAVCSTGEVEEVLVILTDADACTGGGAGCTEYCDAGLVEGGGTLALVSVAGE